MNAVLVQSEPQEHDFSEHKEPALNLILSWERSAEMQIRQLLGNHVDTNAVRPLMIGIVGIPGSGKSTCSNALRCFLEDSGCLVLPHVSLWWCPFCACSIDSIALTHDCLCNTSFRTDIITQLRNLRSLKMPMMQFTGEVHRIRLIPKLCCETYTASATGLKKRFDFLDSNTRLVTPLQMSMNLDGTNIIS